MAVFKPNFQKLHFSFVLVLVSAQVGATLETKVEEGTSVFCELRIHQDVRAQEAECRWRILGGAIWEFAFSEISKDQI